MFLIMGIEQGSRQLKFDQLIVCRNCGQYGHIQVFMTYSYFMFFFIPVFKWDRHYYAKMSCCGAMCELDPESGRQIEKGQITVLSESQLHFTGGNRGSYGYGADAGIHKVCSNCGYATDEDFEFCPKCGKKF